MRFFAITPWLSLIRETHRTVLCWNRFEGRSVEAWTVRLTRDDVAIWRAWLAGDAASWRSGDESLVARRDGTGLVLVFERDGALSELDLDAAASSRLAEGLCNFARR